MSNGQNKTKQCKVHLLDVGRQEYGDAILCQFGKRTVLIDGAHPGDHDGSPGHPSIPNQIKTLLGQDQPYPIDLLIISHAHQDHIGCLPKIIEEGKLKVAWCLTIDPNLGWGRAGGNDFDSAEIDQSVLKLMAALREEVHSERGTLDGELDEFLTDAINLETRYIQMLDTLEEQGTKVVKFGNPQADLKGLIKEFADINFKVLGPEDIHLLECAEEIGKRTRDTMNIVSDFFGRDSVAGEIEIYRRLAHHFSSSRLETSADSLDAKSRPGPMINLQSIITQFEFQGHKFLFAGDFQFADPQTTNPIILDEVENIKSKIKSESPYSFVKISHHGSDNAFSEELLNDLGDTKFFGLCAGETSEKHPHHEVLELLDKHREEINWARTDRNGLVTLSYKKNKPQPEVEIAKGNLNDAKPNQIDLAATISETESFSSPVSETTTSEQPRTESILQKKSQSLTPESISVQSADNDFIEITAKIPNTSGEIQFSGNFSIKIVPAAASVTAEKSSERKSLEHADYYDPNFLIGGGRDVMKDLLFITSAEKLEQNIGQSETRKVLASFEKQEIPIFSNLSPDLRTATEAESQIRRILAENKNAKGVVILGGYDVVPSQIVDTLPTDLRNSLPQNDDPDRFIVWSDEIYGDFDGDGLPEVPVSRIPDGRSAQLIFKALQSESFQTGNNRFGIRNIKRPFATDIFNMLPGQERLLVSKDTVFDQQPPISLEADQIYFMLHGNYQDTRRFWGEGTHLNREAFHISNLPERFKGIVFTGCCWGALTVDTPAGRLHPQISFSPSTVESSIALSFLARGANAFVGCTGAHYSPVEPPFDYFGGPLHAAFWYFYNSGYWAAESLFKAKIEYINQMPHGRNTVIQQAIEYKILRQFTCLGLGW
jgi:beta-lactamase superfamily II metal-dependent hydrolase